MNTIRKLEEKCHFQTTNLSISQWSKDLFTPLQLKMVLTILSPAVTRSLPDGWQNISSEPDVERWLQSRIEESCFLVIKQKDTEIIGFLLLYPEQKEHSTIIHLGYLLGESHWGKGYATELISGLVDWCKKEKDIVRITGGVERGNVASGRVLEKNGFSAMDESLSNTITYELLLQT